MSDATNTTEAEVVADLARQAGEPCAVDPNGGHVLVVEDHQHVEEIDFERFLPTPRRTTGVYTPADANSFIDYVGRHVDATHTTIWVDQIGCKVAAIINDNGQRDGDTQSPGWGDHRAELALVRTPEWTHWLSHDGAWLGQETFAEHLQDGIMEIREPDAATMLEIAQSISGKTSADWKAATRLDNGAVGFSYIEEVQASAGKSGTLEIPSEFILGVAPFYGEQPFEVRARLRYRVRQGSLTIGYRIERPTEVELQVLRGIASRLREDAGFAQVFMGTAPAR